MKLAAWAFIVCASLCVAGVFLPAGELQVTGPSMTENGTMSVYDLSNSRESVQKFLTRYRGSTSKRVGAVVLNKVAPHLKGELASDASDVRDAIAVLDAIEDEDVEAVGTITKATMWTFLVLIGVIGLLLFGITGRSSRLRSVGALIVSLVVAAIGVAIHLVMSRVVAEVNGELGRDLVIVRAGAYVIPLAAIGCAASMIAMVVAHQRASRVFASQPGPVPLPPPPPPGPGPAAA